MILPKVAPITQVPLRHSNIPTILEEKEPSTVRDPQYGKNSYMYEVPPVARYRR